MKRKREREKNGRKGTEQKRTSEQKRLAALAMDWPPQRGGAIVVCIRRSVLTFSSVSMKPDVLYSVDVAIAYGRVTK